MEMNERMKKIVENHPDPATVLIKKLKVKPADRQTASIIEALEAVKIESSADYTQLLGMMDCIKRRADVRFLWSIVLTIAIAVYVAILLGV